MTLMSETTQLKKFSQSPDLDALYAHSVKNYPKAEYYSVYEAGFCGFWIHYRFTELGIHNIVVNPADVPTTVGEKLRKTDAVDSGKLARSLRAGELKGIYVPESESLEIRSLIRLRDSITKDQTLDFLITQYEALRSQRLEMVRALRKLSRTKKFEKLLELLMSVPGVGQMTGMALLSEIVDIKRFNGADHLAAYIGMIPMCHSSGEHEGVGDITLRKNSKLRSVLIEAAWVAVRQDPAMTQAYGEYCKRMMPSKAIIKIARKLVNRIYFVMKRTQPYVECVVA